MWTVQRGWGTRRMSIQGDLGERRELEKLPQDVRVDQSFEIQWDFTEGPRGKIHVTIQMSGKVECILESAGVGRGAWKWGMQRPQWHGCCQRQPLRVSCPCEWVRLYAEDKGPLTRICISMLYIVPYWYALHSAWCGESTHVQRHACRSQRTTLWS